MTIDDFFILKEIYLNNFQNKPYNSGNEGLIYIGLNEKFNKFKDDKQKKNFVNYLSMIVSLDLKIYELNKDSYYKFKSIFNTPKFEYGLTNVYYYPNDIFNKFKVTLNKQIIEECFENFYHFYSIEFKKKSLNIDFDYVLSTLISDREINSGVWGSEFCNCIKNVDFDNVYKESK